MVSDLSRVQSCSDCYLCYGNTYRDYIKGKGLLAIEQQPDNHAEEEDYILNENGQIAAPFWAGEESKIDHNDEYAQQHDLYVDYAGHIHCQSTGEVAW